MYSNNSQSIREALCFFMDEETGSKFAFLQTPQNFENTTKNDIYSHSLRIHSQVEFLSLDGYGGTLYIGTGCFHRRDALCGVVYTKECRNTFKNTQMLRKENNVEPEANLRHLACCTYEINTQWGKEVSIS